MGDTLGPYELVRLLGRGGMGEVHLARDTRLQRDVALKLLPPELAADEERRGRFLREARAAAALNHPNITTILDVGEAAGRDYIAQEYLDGRPLSSILDEQTLPLEELARIAVPLADALAYAHEQGVIHRDLKPANVIITARGHAKLLDFGLAKLLRGEDESGADQISTTLTLEGKVFGTPAAMSPEQALGKVVDARSDIFSFGALLYEMATGKPAFLGATVHETVDKVIHAQPEPLSRLRRDLPSDFVASVDKALRKDPDERYQSMAEMAADLRHFKRSTDSGLVPPGSGAAPTSGRQRALRAAGLLVLLAVAVVAGRALLPGGDAGPGGTSGTLMRFTNPRQVTFSVGTEDWPSWSAEGSLLAYNARASHGTGGKVDIWITQVGSGTPVNRTADLPGDAVSPSLSPDGTTIVFTLVWDVDSTFPSSAGIHAMPVIGGPARMLVPGAFTQGPVQWSADGRQMAWLSLGEDGRWAIRVATATGETVRDIPLPDDDVPGRGDLAWSRDGRYFAFQVTANFMTSDTSRLWLLREADGELVPLTDGRTLARSPSFSPDGRALHYVSNQGGTMDLWRQALDADGAPDGEPVALTAGLGISRAAFSPDGRRVAYGKGGLVMNVWRAPVRDNPVTWADCHQVTFDEAIVELGDLSPDGKWLAITSDRAGNDDIWILPSEGGEMRQLTTDPTPDWNARWSPDGEQILFYAFRTGNRELWVMPSGGGPARQLTDHPASDWFGHWSPDGKRVAWVRWGDGLPELWTSALDPWEPRRMLDPEGEVDVATAWGPWMEDGLLLSVGPDYVLADEQGRVLSVYEGAGSSGFAARVPGTRSMVYARADKLWTLDLDSGEVESFSSLEGRPGRLGIVLGASAEQVWFTWAEERGDLWVMDVEGGG